MPDVHGMVTELDETFYRRILSEPRLSFLAEGYSPKLVLFSGAGWARLWDLFLTNPEGHASGAWASSPLAEELASDLVLELKQVACGLLPVSTVLGALHRNRDHASPEGYETWPEMKVLQEMEAMFLDGVAQIPNGFGREILALGESYNGIVRAWPIALRQSAMRHVRNRVTMLHTVPHCDHLLTGQREVPSVTNTPIQKMVDWLVMLSGGAMTGTEHSTHIDASFGCTVPSMDDRRIGLMRRMQPTWIVGDCLPTMDVYEISEDTLHRAVELRYGFATQSDWSKSRQHLTRLALLVREASRHGPEYWTDGKRRSQQHLPEEVLNDIQQQQVCLSSDEYRTQCMNQLLAIIHDPLADGSAITEHILGESQMRPTSLYPGHTI
jgi:hypothetical protein